jgi:hypothetical protein
VPDSEALLSRCTNDDPPAVGSEDG